jgi:hypothetical protein
MSMIVLSNICEIWYDRFSEIENITEQYLQITVFDSDRGQVPGMKTVVQEKRGVIRFVDVFSERFSFYVALLL